MSQLKKIRQTIDGLWLSNELSNQAYDKLIQSIETSQTIYKRTLNSNMAVALIVMYNYSNNDWVHMENLIADAGHNRCGDATYLKHWGLIEAMGKERADGCQYNGIYKITDLGRIFVEKRAKVQKVLLYSNGQKLGFEGDKIDIQQALNKKFNYSQLMGTRIIQA